MDDYQKTLLKDRIREAVWEGMEIVSKVHARENPYAAGELLEQQQANLNRITDEAFKDIEDHLGDLI